MPMISEATGFFASTLVLITFTMKDMRMLRIIAILSNVAFITYGILDWLLPVVGLHLLLLPLNLIRLKQIQAGAVTQATSKHKLISPRTCQPQLAAGRG